MTADEARSVSAKSPFQTAKVRHEIPAKRRFWIAAWLWLSVNLRIAGFYINFLRLLQKSHTGHADSFYTELGVWARIFRVIPSSA